MPRERLHSYSIHEPPGPPADRIERAEAMQFVRDGFLRQAFLAPPLWLAMNGVWLGVVGYLAAAGLIFGVAWALMLPKVVTLLAFLALHLIFASEADEMLRGHLAARGWSMVGQVTGLGRLDCERRFFDQWLGSAPMTTAARVATKTSSPTATSPPVAAPAASSSPKARVSVLSRLLSFGGKRADRM